jgi:hypothetical protein
MQNQHHESGAREMRSVLFISLAVLIFSLSCLFVRGQSNTRLQQLEKSGEIPEGNQELSDWQLAQKTSWWGKPLDPKEFWKGRLVWDDKKAVSDAHRHGRLYPPMPYEDTNLPPFPNDDGIHGTYLPDSPNILYADSAKERAFWDRFDKTHPQSPDRIEHQQLFDASRVLRMGDSEIIREQAAALNYPTGAFTKDAIFWTYVQSKRVEYQKILNSTGSTNALLMTFFGMLIVDRKYVTEPLTPDQKAAASAAMAWRIDYLKRLQSQKIGQSYINAYLKAWNIQSGELVDSGK